MGKTLLAEEYVRRFAAAWPGGIFWLRAGGAIADQYFMIATALGVKFDLADPASLTRAVTSALAARPGRYVWVVDDLPHGLTADQARAWFAPTSNGHTLITTRTRTLDTIAHPVPLPELSTEEAFHLLTLTKRPQTDAEIAAAYAIIEALGGHALAIDLARHLVDLQGYQDVLADLQDPSEEALSLATELEVELPTGHEKSITQTFLRSLQSIDSNALDALRLAAPLAPNTPIPTDFLAAILQKLDDLPEKQAKRHALSAIDRSANHSLCDRSDTGYAVHALVCRTMALRYADARSEALEQACLNLLLEHFQQADDIRNHPALATLLAHAAALCQEPQTEHQANLASWVGHYYRSAGLYEFAYRYFRFALDAVGRLLGPNHPSTLTSMSNLADILLAQGEWAGAKDLHEQCLIVRGRLLGADHPDTLASINNLALVLQAQGDLVEAKGLLEQCLRAQRQNLGSDHPSALKIMNNLAGVLQDLGDLAGARDLLDQCLSAQSRVLDPDHPDTLTCMNNLAELSLTQGDLVRAKDLQERCLLARRIVFGSDHPATLTSTNNLARVLHALGDLPGAKMLHDQCLSALRRCLGLDHPFTLASMNNLAATFRAQGDLAGAKELQEQCLSARRRLLGPDHPDALMSAVMLAQYEAILGSLAKAIALARDSAQGLTAKLGQRHPHTIMAVEVLSRLTAWQKSDPSPG